MFESCLIGGDHGVSNELYNETTPRAAKEHECCECYGVIRKGERYELAKGRIDGDWWSSKTCMICRSIRVSLVRGDWFVGDLWGGIVEAYCGGDSDIIAMAPDTWIARARPRLTAQRTICEGD